MLVITDPNAPVKPLTEVERAFAAALLGWKAPRRARERPSLEGHVTLIEAAVILKAAYSGVVKRKEEWQPVMVKGIWFVREVDVIASRDLVVGKPPHMRRDYWLKAQAKQA